MSRNVTIVITLVLIALFVIMYTLFKRPDDDGCAIAPPKDAKVNREIALKAAADLSKLAKLPATGEAQVTAKNTAERTFQMIPDADVACHMLLQTINCLSQKTGNEATVQSLVAYLKDGDKCGPHPSPKNAYQLRIQGQPIVTASDNFELDLGYVEVGKKLTVPLTLIARLPGDPQIKITHTEQPMAAKWQAGSETIVANEQTPGVLVLSIPAQQPVKAFTEGETTNLTAPRGGVYRKAQVGERTAASMRPKPIARRACPRLTLQPPWLHRQAPRRSTSTPTWATPRLAS